MANYTPGPWRADSEMIQCQGKWQDENGEHFDWKYPRVLAHVVDDWDYRANARLIAAAPELLEALQGLANALEATPGPRGVMELVPSQLENARAVIRKARGE